MEPGEAPPVGTHARFRHMTEARPSRLAAHWPWVVAVTALLIAVGRLAFTITRRLDGSFVYCLDDAYIHLAIAKNLAAHHVWGVTPYQFASASSSPLWVVLLAADFVVQGQNTSIPLALNVVSAVAALIVGGLFLRRRGVNPIVAAGALLAVVFLLPLPTLIIEGMEHSLHILLVFAWVFLLDARLRSPGPFTRGQLVALCVLAAVMSVCRYESVFLVFMTCAVLFLLKRRVEAVLIGLSAWTLVGAFAAYSVAHGGRALPNSVLLKGAPRYWQSAADIAHALGGKAVRELLNNPHIAVVVVAAVVALWSLGRAGQSRLSPSRALLIVFIGTTLLHLQFAQTNWFYRYEGYLLALGFLTLGSAAADGRLLPGPKWGVALAVALLVVPLVTRSAKALSITTDAAKNIHDQQWQLGRFLKAQMGDRSVAFYDIGSVSYLSEVHLVDLAGLGSLDVAEVMMQGGFHKRPFAELVQSHRVELVAVPLSLFVKLVPPNWTLIGRWTAPEPNRLLMEPVVTFFATDQADAADLKTRLRAFSKSELPTDVRWDVY